MRQLTLYCIGAALLALCPAAPATTFTYNTEPFAGTNVLNTPGRQLVGGEDFLSFFVASDVFSIDAVAFGVAGPVRFVDSTAANLLRARLFSTVRHRLPLLLTGLAGLLLLMSRLAGADLPVQVGVGVGLLLVAVLVVTAGMRYSVRPPSVQLGRLADIFDVLLVLATIPIVCQVLGLYAWVRGLAG